MAPNHRYDIINENDDLKEGGEIREPLNHPSNLPPWWKIVLGLALAASVGFGAAIGVVVGTSILSSHNNAPANAAAVAATTSSVGAAATASPDLALPATSVAEVDTSQDPEDLRGKVLDCGYSPAEARARGCVYDVMMQDWVPEPCYDPVLTQRFLDAGNYTWYSDADGTVMSDEEMRKGEHHAAWMAATYHKAHCIFTWEKLIRALRNNEPIGQELLSYDHVLHCRMQTLGDLGGMPMAKRGDGAIGVYAPTNYAKCALYNTWRTDFLPDKHSTNDK